MSPIAPGAVREYYSPDGKPVARASSKRSSGKRFTRTNTTISTLPATGATMSFFRHTEIYRSDRRRWKRRKPTEVGLPDHRLDESPAGYSSAGCSPAGPASASPADAKFKEEE